MGSPSQRTLALLRKEGWEPGIVERWIQRAFKRIDLYGCIDILAIRDGVILGVQTTSGSNASAHVKKAMAEPRLVKWLKAGGEFEIWSWTKKGSKGKRKLWTVRKQPIVLLSGILYAKEMKL